MKTLFRACAVCLFWFGFAHAAVEGDPFSDGQAFSDLHAIEASDTFLLGGFAESRNQFSLNDPETPISLRQKVQVEALWRRDVLSLFGSLEGSYEGAAHTWPGDHSPWKADLRELYLTYDTDNIDIFLGRKTHRWGTGDGINPMDLINPLDTRDPVTTGRADNRLPVWLFSGTVSGNGISFEGVFLPKAEVNALPRSGNPWEPRALRELRRQRDDGLLRDVFLAHKKYELLYQQIELLDRENSHKCVSPAECRAAHRAYAILLQDIGKPPSLPELAAAVGVNRTRLTALFRMLFEDTVFGILRRERLECARRLLNEKGKNITEIAYLCGFSSPSHLTKAFSAQFGISPKQYQIARRHGHPAASVSCDEQHT